MNISLEKVAGKLNRVGYEAFFKALRQAKGTGTPHVELAHWLSHILVRERSDMRLIAAYFALDYDRLVKDIAATIDALPKNEVPMPAVSMPVMDMLDRGWHYATLFFDEKQIRTGHILVGALLSKQLSSVFSNASQEFEKIAVDTLMAQYSIICAGSEEEHLGPMADVDKLVEVDDVTVSRKLIEVRNRIATMLNEIDLVIRRSS